MSLEALFATFQATPIEEQPELLERMWAAGPDRLTWAMALFFAWRHDSWPMQQRVGRAQLVEWWQAADYDAGLPGWYGEIIGTRAELPASFTVYRGGWQAAPIVAHGLSWSRDLGAACAMARERRADYGSSFAPAVVRAVVRREDVLWRYRGRWASFGEVILPEVRDWRMVTRRMDVIETFAAEFSPRAKAAREHLRARIRELRASPDRYGLGEVA